MEQVKRVMRKKCYLVACCCRREGNVDLLALVAGNIDEKVLSKLTVNACLLMSRGFVAFKRTRMSRFLVNL